MRRILHLVLAALIGLLPFEASAQSKYDAPGSSAKKKKKKAVKSKAAEQEEEAEAERSQSQGSRRKKRRQPKVIEVEQPPEEGGTAAKPPPEGGEGGGGEERKTVEPVKPKPAPVEEEEEEEVDIENDPSKWGAALSARLPPRRYAYVIGVAMGGIGLVFAYQAQGEAKRAETITSSLEAQRAVANARASASVANVMYGLAAAAVLTAIILEFLPEPMAEKANFTFHF